VDFGRPGVDQIGVRIYPMDGGEGHFAAKLRRKSKNPCFVQPYALLRDTAEIGEAKGVYTELFTDRPTGSFALSGSKFYLLPEDLPRILSAARESAADFRTACAAYGTAFRQNERQAHRAGA